jgi:hypothetical protein
MESAGLRSATARAHLSPLLNCTYRYFKLICLIKVQLDVHYILYFFLDIVSSKCFGCYLHPSSGAQLQRTAIGFVWFGVLLHWGKYWYGTALQLSTVSYSTAIGCVWFGVLLNWG